MEKSKEVEILLNEFLTQSSSSGVDKIVKFYVKFLKLGGLVRERDKNTLFEHFDKLLNYCRDEAIKLGDNISKKQRHDLKDASGIFIHFIEFPIEIHNLEYSGEYDFDFYSVQYDLPTFVIAAILLESEPTRKAFSTHTISMRDAELTRMYNICKDEIPGQVFSTIESFKKVAEIIIREIWRVNGW